jgi:aminoglycoside/choline kinase family phosphotransferase
MTTKIPTYTQELFIKNASLFLDWSEIPFSESAQEEFKGLWKEAYLHQPQLPHTLTLRDVMVDNLLWLSDREGFQRCGFIDFQDGSWGPITYDLVALLEDARRDISPSFAREMLEIHFAAFPTLSRDDFWASYYLWGAQRTTRILGVFFRLAKRDGKVHYLTHVPRLWKTLKRDLEHSSLHAIGDWFRLYGGLA